ncbi:MAG: hybrid sensor histidine kinase/response regulator [Bacteroidales bacterium]|nr:hybrid sensor histidine kinase/response regulator [Bacteroidales bacterium]
MNGQEIVKYKILIVDDVAKNIQLVANFLTKAGYQINFALDGPSALEHANRDKFDLIILDIMMPGMDGFEVCRKLKENMVTTDVPVIFLTAKTDDISIARGFEAGGVDYIAKPFNPAELLARVKTHIRLRQREVELTNLNRTKDVFLSIIGHDLKTPVANIVSLGEILNNNLADISEGEKTELINDMVESGRQGLWLLENLLSWTRIQTGKIPYNPQELILHEVIEKNISFIAPVALRKSIQTQSDCDKNLKVNTDVNILNTILRNLLSNAIKFTPVDGEVWLKANKEANGEILVYVTDNGVGIDKQRLDSLFKTIGQVSTLGTQNEKGSGLGLALVNDLVNIIGARIEVESEPGIGSTFKLYLKEE